MKPLIGITQDIEPRKNGGWKTYVDKAYEDAVYRAGGMPVLLPVLEKFDELPELVSRLDGVLFSGGEDIHPRYYGEEITGPMDLSPDMRTEFEFKLLEEALARQKPVLAICLGIQALNVHLGGTIIQDMPNHKDRSLGVKLTHEASVVEGTLLRKIVKDDLLRVNSTHHQAVKELGKGLVTCATAPDGIIEAVELPGAGFVLGVQWHPEKTMDKPASRKIFSAFIKACIS